MFTAMSDLRYADEVVSLMRALYTEDETTAADAGLFPRTIEVLLAEPDRGRIILFLQDEALCGYGLLIPYWSNEFGGTLLFVDEIFVRPDARNRGIARRFFAWLAAERPFGAVAAALEVSPGNPRAQRLYESLGFLRRLHSTFACRFPVSRAD